MPDFFAYHRSLTDEIYSLKNRIRNLVNHWGTDGEHKEVALRSILRRHLPESVLVGRGFIVTPNSASTQIDILIVDNNKPTLFKDGDLLIVTPDAVRAVIEVKTALRSPQTKENALVKLAEVEKLCREEGIENIWTGLFVYEGYKSPHASQYEPQHENLLKSIAKAYESKKLPINCVSYGKNLFIRHWETGSVVSSPVQDSVWHSYHLQSMAPAYFVGNVVDSISSVDRRTSSFAWFPIPHGKEAKRVFYLEQGKEQPQRFSEVE